MSCHTADTDQKEVQHSPSELPKGTASTDFEASATAVHCVGKQTLGTAVQRRFEHPAFP